MGRGNGDVGGKLTDTKMEFRQKNKETSLRESGGDLRRKKSWEMKENAGYH